MAPSVNTICSAGVNPSEVDALNNNNNNEGKSAKADQFLEHQLRNRKAKLSAEVLKAEVKISPVVPTTILAEVEVAPTEEKLAEGKEAFKPKYTGYEIIWVNAISIIMLHALAVYSLCAFIHLAKWQSWAWGVALGGIGGFGVTAGAHRLWSHRAYKAKTPLRILLILCYSVAGQNTLFDWVRDHRVHHKFTETDADPHNVKRGFFFAHVGWLMKRKHPDVLRKGRQVDMSDIVNDPVVKFHMKYFTPLKLMLCFVIPMLVPRYCWDEPWSVAILSMGVVRYIFTLNFTWLVNSAAHMFGSKPYDNRINPTENLGVSIVAMGEGWHNYHHVFPWDYKAAELPNYFNVTTFWINLFARIGWAYDLRTASDKLIRNVCEKRGDGSHPRFGSQSHDHEHGHDHDHDHGHPQEVSYEEYVELARKEGVPVQS